ncbi:tail fiber assembly protein [Erwinia sp. JH02]|uniref:tail fiber assembly protein n=1 Tax=Erwinia sp. JH02 TaxID=2733394 RepID=UPI0014897363|nr:tail fiber assembly protein [Erwinia sp. JH02]NNS06208.1 tail assembly chaperone [Erwinia sp. JH02]
MIIYVSTEDHRSYGFSSELWNGNVIKVIVPEDFSGGNKTYDPNTGIWTSDPIPDRDYIEEAQGQKDQLYDDALSFINSKQWPSKLALGRLSEKDKTSYNAVLDYMDALDQLDLTTAPDIEWPVSPL